MPRIPEEVEKKPEANPEVEQQVQVITENQLINWKLDRIIELLEAKK